MQIADTIAEPLQLALVPLPPEARIAATSEIDRAVAGPGWFDSSWDLRRGLEVRELEAESGRFAQRTLRVVARRTSSRTASPSSITASA